MAQSHREASRRLFEIAEQQQAFFTTKQAKAAGFAENTHPYHVQVGKLDPRNTVAFTGSLCFRPQIGPTSSFGRCGRGTGTKKLKESTVTIRC